MKILQIICERPSCAFRVHDRYFLDKVQFAPGSCPVDGGPLAVVADYSDRRDTRFHIETDPAATNFRRVVERTQEAA